MSSISEVGSVVRARVSDREGAGEPPGEPASPPGILGAMQNDLRGKLSDELVDELLAGASSEEEIVGPGQHSRLVERAMSRADRSPRLQTEHGPVEIQAPRARDGFL